MGQFTAIAEVTESIIQVLDAAYAAAGLAVTVEASDLQGNISTAPARLTVFLFQVKEDGHARNRPPTVQPGVPQATLQKPPLALAVHYLLTPWSGSRQSDQQILGIALQTLHESAIITGPSLVGSLASGNEALHLTLTPLTIEEQTRVWVAVQKPYRLSLHYEVRVVRIESLEATLRSTVRSRGLAPASPSEVAP